MRRRLSIVLALVAWLPAFAAPTAAQLAARLHVPPGFSVSLFADNVPNAREMAWGDHGTLFVGSSDAGKVYALRDANHDGRADSVQVIAGGLRTPVGVAFRDGALYVSAVDRILRYDRIESHLDAPPQPVVVVGDLPGEAHHGWRYLAFGPDGKLYVPIGEPCNVCDRPGYGKLTRMNPDGSGREDVAYGIRNTVGFAWSPRSGHLWFTDNGRDLMGDDVPDDELNVVTKPRQHFGFPYCHAGDVLDPEFGKGKSCHDYVPPAAKLGAHVASLGIAFYTGTMFPAAWRGNAFIAEHGSWNRSSKSGYRVVRVAIDGDKVVDVTPFLTGFLDGQTTLGRPDAVIQAPDGALLVSDDFLGAIYRIAWSGGRR
ncbi:MAG TPA: PQQ-dependent sugar dehydrogenase [Xanthomonadaceae bacterium]|jgi:glucose/arabinose dehydrogenase